MIHHSGHGVGLLAWEDPWIGPSAHGSLAEGMTIAIEPGLYVPGWGGMRLEGNYLITATGFDRLDPVPLDADRGRRLTRGVPQPARRGRRRASITGRAPGAGSWRACSPARRRWW